MRKTQGYLLKIYFIHLKLGFKNSWCQNSASEKILEHNGKVIDSTQILPNSPRIQQQKRTPFTQRRQRTRHCRNREQRVLNPPLRFWSWTRVHPYGCAQLLKHRDVPEQVVSAKLGTGGNTFGPLWANTSVGNSPDPPHEIGWCTHRPQWGCGTQQDL